MAMLHSVGTARAWQVRRACRRSGYAEVVQQMVLPYATPKNRPLTYPVRDLNCHYKCLFPSRRFLPRGQAHCHARPPGQGASKHILAAETRHAFPVSVEGARRRDGTSGGDGMTGAAPAPAPALQRLYNVQIRRAACTRCISTRAATRRLRSNHMRETTLS